MAQNSQTTVKTDQAPRDDAQVIRRRPLALTLPAGSRSRLRAALKSLEARRTARAS